MVAGLAGHYNCNRVEDHRGNTSAYCWQSMLKWLWRPGVAWNRTLIQFREHLDEMQSRLLEMAGLVESAIHQSVIALVQRDEQAARDVFANITHRALSLMRQPRLKLLIDIPQIASLAENMVRNSLDALVKRDEDLARSVLLSDNGVDHLRDLAYKELVGFMQEQSTTIPGAVDLMFIAHNLERIADHATNIAEDVLFLVKGIDVRHHAEARKVERDTQ
jgi:phosphate transport system protein